MDHVSSQTSFTTQVGVQYNRVVARVARLEVVAFRVFSPPGRSELRVSGCVHGTRRHPRPTLAAHLRQGRRMLVAVDDAHTGCACQILGLEVREVIAEMIAIVDYRMGNLRSVQKGFEKVGQRRW